MGLRGKTSFTIGLAFVFFLAAVFVFLQTFFLQTFTDLEKKEVTFETTRTKEALASMGKTINSLDRDYAAWAETYDYMAGKNPDFLKNNVATSTFLDFQVNFFLFFDTTGTLVYGQGVNFEDGLSLLLEEPLKAIVGSPLLKHKDAQDNTIGLVMSPAGPILLASQPIVTTEGEGPVRGTLILGRHLDDSLAAHLSEVTGNQIRFGRLDDPSLDFKASDFTDDVLLRPINGRQMHAYILFRDIYGQPVVFADLFLNRDIYQHGQQSVYYFFFLFLLSAVLVEIILVIALDRILLGRLLRLSKEVKNIGLSGDFSHRVSSSGGDDELSSLVKEMNSSLFELESVHKKLKESETILGERANTLQEKVGELSRAEKAMMNILEDVRGLEVVLREERDRARAVVSSMGEGLILVDDKFKVLVLNQAGGAMIRYTPSEVVGRDLQKIFHLFDAQGQPINLVQVLEKVVRRGDVVRYSLTDQIFSRCLHYKNCKELPVAVTITPFTSDEVAGAVIVFQDISREKELDEAKTNFISIASHQLRTPLTSIRWYAEMLAGGDAGDLNREQKKLVSQVYAGSLRLNKIINLLLSLARVESGKMGEAPTKIALNQLVKNILADFQSAIKENKISVQTDVPEELVFNFDLFKLRQVLNNILSNAVRYSYKKGRVEIRAEKHKGQVTVSVKDNGIGIPEDQKDKIFSRFFRASNAVKYIPDGTGLGLSLVKALVESWRGKVWFESSPKRGTAFYFTIPLS